MENYNETIKKVIAQKLGVDESDVLPQSELVADFGADSLDLVEIMMKLEVVFDIKVSDDEMLILARNVANKIENDLDYPGQIKVNVIRENRAVEYAK